MSFYVNRDNNWYLGDTSIENIYINEYMVGAPGDYVKAYIFARMHAQIGSELTNSMIAMELGMADEDVLKAWTYWESKGVIRKHLHSPDNPYSYDVEFLSLKEGQIRPVEEIIHEPEEKHLLEDEEIQGLYFAIERQIGRPLSFEEMKSASDWLTDMGADPEVIIYAYRQAQEKGILTSRYVGGIIRNWTEQGLKSAADVEMYLNDTSERRYLYRRVFRALGFERNWTEKEKRMMDVWFDDYGFTIDRVIEACDKSSGISNPNINYVNKILSNWHEENEKEKSSGVTGKKVSSSLVLRYYEYLRNSEEDAARKRRDEVFAKVPEIKNIEAELSELNMTMTKTMFGAAGSERDEKIESIRQKMDSLTVDKAIILTENNFPPDYMEIRYSCETCQDTGVTPEGGRCECFNIRAEEAIKWEKTQK